MAANTGQAHMIRPRGVGRNRRSDATKSTPTPDAELKSGDGRKAATQAEFSGATTTVRHKRRRRYESAIHGRSGAERGIGEGQDRQALTAHRFERPAHQRRELLQAKLSDTSREAQIRFLSDHGPLGGPSQNTGKLAMMVCRLSGMVKDQLGQFTGDEPYRRADYRLFLEAFEGLRNGKKCEPADPWAGAAFGTDLTAKMSEALSVFDLFAHPNVIGREYNKVI